MGNYHHHQNPSAFDLDLVEVSDVCNLYDADGLYVINPNEHSPLIGFAYDGFPIYGAYGFQNTDGTGPIVRIQSGYQLRDITVRTHYADGTDVTDGPAVSDTYPLGHYREDYEFVTHPGEPQYLDEHNGRWCITPEYPNGIYAYFCTVDENHNSAYPYCVGPTFYGNKVAAKVTSIAESVTTYTEAVSKVEAAISNEFSIEIFPNPTHETLAVQIKGLNQENKQLSLFDAKGALVKSTTIPAGAPSATWIFARFIQEIIF
ncbi:MAG: YHYH protein [Flavobacteriales bacterium]